MVVGDLLNKALRNTIKIASVYVGTVLGAGFASGQEMMKFFTLYGYKGMFGLVITGMLFGMIGFATLTIIREKGCRSYNDFINHVAGKHLAIAFEIIVMFFMFISLCAMFAGSGALLEQRFDIPYYIGVLLMAVCCYITFIFDVKGIIVINTALAPILFIGTLLIGIYIWAYRDTVVMYQASSLLKQVRDNWISSSILYVAYNSLTAIVVLSSLGYLLYKKSVVKWGSVLSGFSLGMIGLTLGWIVLTFYQDIKALEVPLLGVVMKFSDIIQYLYIILLISAMFTTAVANGFGLIERIKGMHPKANKWASIIVLSGGIALSSIGFSTIVGTVYPLFGYIGLIEIILIGLFFIRRNIKNIR